MSAPMSAAWRLRLLTAARKVEVEKMRWSEIDGDWWTIPGERSKNGKSHRVPLSDLALEALAGLERVNDYVLAGARGKRKQAAGARLIAIDDFQGHDLRRTAASMMASAGVARHVIGRVLNHADGGVTAVYDRHSYDGEKRAALDALARKVRSIVEPGEGAEVVPIRRR
jgi:integrase